MGLTVYGGGGKPEEEKTVTAGTSAIVVNPSSGKVMKKVTVNPTPSQSKTVTPSTSQQTVSPDSGKLLSQVIVKAMEDVTPEVTAQTPVITQIAENLGVTITTPSGTNKQILQGNNANLLNIKNNAKKEGAYVWKKLTAQGGDFVDFVVSDSPTAYPDGGTQGGYWYEKVVEGFDLSRLGFSKYAVDTYVSSTRLSLKSQTVPHSLGEKPDFALIITSDGSQVTTVGDIYYASWRTVGDLSSFGITSLTVGLARSDSTATILQFDNDRGLASRYFVAGLEYTVITGKF